MTLFDNIPRDDEGPASYAEPQFNYLNRSARGDVAKVRKTLEDWFSRYSDEARTALLGNFRSPNDNQHRSAFFELFLHELLLSLGCRVEIHPEPNNTKKARPDFRIHSPTHNHFYLEAVLATDESDEEAAARARLNTFYDAIDRMDSPNFFIGVDIEGEPKTPPPAKRIRGFLTQRLAGLDPDEIGRLIESDGFDALPRWRFRYPGCVVEFYPIPKSSKLRGKPGVRPIGMQAGKGGWIDSRTPIKDAIVRKGRRYGKLDLPYVIAVNALGEHVDKTDIEEALFGKEQYTYRSTPRGIIGPIPGRTPDGAWTSKSGPRYKRVSGALLAIQLYPWSVPRADIHLYHNPWATKPYKGELKRLPSAIANRQENRMEQLGGESLGAIFGLPPLWPSNASYK